MNWLLENKEWIFSGIGVAISTFIMASLFRKRKDTSSTSNTNVSTVQTNTSGTNISAAEISNLTIHNHPQKTDDSRIHPVPVDSFLSMTVEEILEEVNNRPLYQHDEAKTYYIGSRIRFIGVLFSLDKVENEMVYVYLSPEKEWEVPKVRFKVKISDYPQLKIMKRNARVSVSGKIDTINCSDIYLVDVTIT